MKRGIIFLLFIFSLGNAIAQDTAPSGRIEVSGDIESPSCEISVWGGDTNMGARPLPDDTSTETEIATGDYALNLMRCDPSAPLFVTVMAETVTGSDELIKNHLSGDKSSSGVYLRLVQSEDTTSGTPLTDPGGHPLDPYEALKVKKKYHVTHGNFSHVFLKLKFYVYTGILSGQNVTAGNYQFPITLQMSNL